MDSDAQIVSLREVAVHLHPRDDVAIAKIDLQPGTTLKLIETTETPVTVHQLIRSGQSLPAADCRR
jgi:hypothetical protein